MDPLNILIERKPPAQAVNQGTTEQAQAQKRADKRAKVVSIISAKGGVGKTTVTANLGVLLSRFGLRCLVIDGDMGLPSVGFHLNIIEPEITLPDYLNGKFSIEQAVVSHGSGLKVIAGSLSNECAPTDKLREGINRLASQYDWILIDTPASLGDNLRRMIASSDEALLVSSLDLPSLSGSLKAAKMALELNVPIRGVVLNRVRGKDYEIEVREVEDILKLPVIASIPEDQMIQESLSKKTTVSEHSNGSAASRELRKLAELLAGAEPKKKGLIERILGFLRG